MFQYVETELLVYLPCFLNYNIHSIYKVNMVTAHLCYSCSVCLLVCWVPLFQSIWNH